MFRDLLEEESFGEQKGVDSISYSRPRMSKEDFENFKAWRHRIRVQGIAGLRSSAYHANFVEGRPRSQL